MSGKDRTTSPGAVLTGMLKARNLTSSALAGYMHVLPHVIDNLIADSDGQPITEELAHLLARELGPSPTFWIWLEEVYQKSEAARKQKKDRKIPLSEIARLCGTVVEGPWDYEYDVEKHNYRIIPAGGRKRCPVAQVTSQHPIGSTSFEEEAKFIVMAISVLPALVEFVKLAVQSYPDGAGHELEKLGIEVDETWWGDTAQKLGEKEKKG